MWEGTPAAAAAESRIFTPDLILPDFETDRFRLEINAGAVPGYNEVGSALSEMPFAILTCVYVCVSVCVCLSVCVFV